MSTRRPAIAILTTLLAAGLQTMAFAGNFGVENVDPGKPAHPKVELHDVLEQPASNHEKDVRIEGTIETVCQNKGCWLIVGDGSARMRVRFHDYSFFVPMGSAGRKVILEGRLEKTVLTEEEARHYASETPGGDPSAIHGDQETLMMMAKGVYIDGLEPPDGKAPMSEPESGGAEAGSGSSRHRHGHGADDDAAHGHDH